MSLKIKPAYDEFDSIVELFTEYTSALKEIDPTITLYLGLQNYDQEIQDLNEKYGLPKGRLYIAYYENQIAGCIALRQLNDTECEMKRLYVKPKFRKHKIGTKLVETIIKDAKEIGYKAMLLDTLPSLVPAIKLYENTGFHYISAYNDSPAEATIFMKLDL